MSIKPDYFTLDTLLQKRLFRIPDYQRAYSWETKQRKDLFDDIEKLTHYDDNDRHHFMATIVCLKMSQKEEIGADEYGVFEVVDGQQRLTTLIILLKALAKYISANVGITQKEADKLNELLVKEDKRLILLQTNHDNFSIFRNYLENGALPEEKIIKTLADRNLVRAFRECEEFVKKWNSDLLTLLKIVKNRLDFIFYVLEKEAAVYTIFEVLNSRGLPVDWLDKCKSMLMGIAFEKFDTHASSEHIKELHNCWTKIYQTIGLRKVPGHEILRFAATLMHPDSQNRIIGAESAIEYFREYCEKAPKTIIEVSQEFLNVAIKLEQLYENPRLSAVTDIIQARLLAVAIMLNESLDNPAKKIVLDQWERVSFRIFGLFRKDSRTKIGDYTRLACDVFDNKLTKNQILSAINAIGSGKEHQIQLAVEQMRGADCYRGCENDLRYFFYRYEEYVAKKNGSDVSKEIWEQIWRASPTTTIEHIYPQSPNAAWKGKLGRGRNRYDRFVNCLGNLMILPPKVNSKAGAKSFVEKKAIYKKNYLRLMDEVLKKKDWNHATIQEREEHLFSWMEETWS